MPSVPNNLPTLNILLFFPFADPCSENQDRPYCNISSYKTKRNVRLPTLFHSPPYPKRLTGLHHIVDSQQLHTLLDAIDTSGN